MFFKKLLTTFILLISAHIHADVIPYKEDPYTQQAPQEIVNLVKQVADLMEYKDGFEVVVAKKAGIELNPWNKFIGHGKNPSTQNHFISINPEWFASLPQDQQTFLLARCFVIFQEGPLKSLQIVWILYIIFSIFLMLLVYWLLGKSSFQLKRWMRVICAIGAVILAETLIFDKIHVYIVRRLSSNFDIYVAEKTIEKTGNKDAAIKALQYFDASINQAIQNGETIFVPFKDWFGKVVQELAKK